MDDFLKIYSEQLKVITLLKTGLSYECLQETLTLCRRAIAINLNFKRMPPQVSLREFLKVFQKIVLCNTCKDWFFRKLH